MLTIEKFDNVCKVHFVVNDNFSVVLNESQSDKEYKTGRRNVLCRPDGLPD